MSTYPDGGSNIRFILVCLVAGVTTVLALKVTLVAFGLLTRFALYALVTLGPIVLVGWLVLKALRYFSRETEAPTY